LSDATGLAIFCAEHGIYRKALRAPYFPSINRVDARSILGFRIEAVLVNTPVNFQFKILWVPLSRMVVSPRSRFDYRIPGHHPNVSPCLNGANILKGNSRSG
jgi:hypothetical protein